LKSSITALHFSLPPAIPITLAPVLFANCPAVEPTEP